MKLFKAKILDYYLSEQYELSTSDADLNFIEKFVNIESFKDIRDKYSDIIEPSLQNIRSLDEIPFQENLNEIKRLINQHPRFESFLIDVLRSSHENLVSMWKSFYYYDEYLFKIFSELMDSVNKEERVTLQGIIVDFQKERINGLSLLQKIQSTLDISEVKAEVHFKIKDGSFALKHLDSKRWDIIQRLNKKSMDEQQINVHNWCKELGDLIEDQFKRTIYFISSINYLVKTGKKYSANKPLKSLSIRDVLLAFSKDFNTYENISLIHHLRNSVAHANFKWESSQPIEDSNIRFDDKRWENTLSFNQLLLIYFKLVTLVATFELVVMITHLNLLDDSKPIGQVMKEVCDQLFQTSLKSIKDWFKMSKDNPD